MGSLLTRGIFTTRRLSPSTRRRRRISSRVVCQDHIRSSHAASVRQTRWREPGSDSRRRSRVLLWSSALGSASATPRRERRSERRSSKKSAPPQRIRDEGFAWTSWHRSCVRGGSARSSGSCRPHMPLGSTPRPAAKRGPCGRRPPQGPRSLGGAGALSQPMAKKRRAFVAMILVRTSSSMSRRSRSGFVLSGKFESQCG